MSGLCICCLYLCIYQHKYDCRTSSEGNRFVTFPISWVPAWFRQLRGLIYMKLSRCPPSSVLWIHKLIAQKIREWRMFEIQSYREKDGLSGPKKKKLLQISTEWIKPKALYSIHFYIQKIQIIVAVFWGYTLGLGSILMVPPVHFPEISLLLHTLMRTATAVYFLVFRREIECWSAIN